MSETDRERPADRERASDRERAAARAAWAVFGAAALSAVALLLWLNRGTTFYFDEMIWFADLSDYTGPDSVLLPHNSHLHGTTRAVYFAVMELFGSERLIVRLLGVASVVLCAGLFFAYARRRLAPAVALVPAVLLLFYGSAWQHVAGSIGFTVLLSAAFGIAALLALDRDDRRGDIIACACVTLAAFTFTVGLGFIVGVAVWILLSRDRLRRAWVFAVPLGLYATWWLWALQFDQGRAGWKDPLYVVEYLGHSLAVVTGALTGVNVPFSRFGEVGAISEAPASALGWIVAALFLAALIWRISRGNVPRALWAAIGITVTYWVAGAIADPLFFGSQADAIRYVYPGSIGVLLIATEIARGIAIRGVALAGVIVVGVFSLAMNVVFLVDGGEYLRSHSAEVEAQLAALELAAGLEPGSEDPDPQRISTARLADDIPYLALGPDRADYLEAIARYGSPASDLEEIRGRPLATRATADTALVQTYGLALAPAANRPDRRDCRRVGGGAAGNEIAVPAGEVFVRAISPPEFGVGIARFSTGVALTPAAQRDWQTVSLPRDAAPDRWRVTVPAAAVADVCSGRPG